MRYWNHWPGLNPGGWMLMSVGVTSPILPNPAASYASKVLESSTKASSRGMDGLRSRNLASFSESPTEMKVREVPFALRAGMLSTHALA